MARPVPVGNADDGARLAKHGRASGREVDRRGRPVSRGRKDPDEGGADEY